MFFLNADIYKIVYSSRLEGDDQGSSGPKPSDQARTIIPTTDMGDQKKAGSCC